MHIYTVYDNPSDFPGTYVARKFLFDQPLDVTYANEDLGAVRRWVMAELRKEGIMATCMPRSQNDDPVIVESWI